VTDCLDVCKFATFAESLDGSPLNSRPWRANVYRQRPLTIGERVYNLERYYNNLNGFDGKDDSLRAAS